MVQTLKTYLPYIVILAIGFSIGKFSGPTETKEVEKIVYRETVSDKKNVSVTTKTKQTILPDGTTVNESVSKTKDKSETNKSASLDRVKETSSKSAPKWRVNVLYIPGMAGVQDTNYMLDIQRHLISNSYIGVNVSTKKTIGVSFSIGF